MTDRKRQLEPANLEEPLRGLTLHTHKARECHDLGAQRYKSRRLGFDVPTMILSAIASTSIFASLGERAATWTHVPVPGYAVTDFATGFVCQVALCLGPRGLAFDAAGNLFVADWVGSLYRFGPAGGV